MDFRKHHLVVDRTYDVQKLLSRSESRLESRLESNSTHEAKLSYCV